MIFLCPCYVFAFTFNSLSITLIEIFINLSLSFIASLAFLFQYFAREIDSYTICSGSTLPISEIAFSNILKEFSSTLFTLDNSFLVVRHDFLSSLLSTAILKIKNINTQIYFFSCASYLNVFACASRHFFYKIVLYAISLRQMNEYNILNS